MPTPAERKALVFLAGIALLGAGVRVTRAVRNAPAPDPAAERALSQQLRAVDSARTAPKPGNKSRKAKKPSVRSVANSGRIDPRYPPSLLDLQHRTLTKTPSTLGPRPSALKTIDLDLATTAEIDLLPFIGPVLAARIVADRDSLGPFGSLENFQRVRGVGPAMAERLRARVTFSGSARPTTATDRTRRRVLKSKRASSETGGRR